MTDRTEGDADRLDRELGELLEEIRVALPGAEVLFAFLLGIAFTERFDHVTSLQEMIYFAALLLTAGATALLIAPTAYHRLRFRDGDKEHMVVAATRMAIGSLGLLMLAVAGTVFLVADLLYEFKLAGVVAGLTAAWFAWFWFGLPLTRAAAQADRSS